jgi:hypothetical protein
MITYQVSSKDGTTSIETTIQSLAYDFEYRLAQERRPSIVTVKVKGVEAYKQLLRQGYILKVIQYDQDEYTIQLVK